MHKHNGSTAAFFNEGQLHPEPEFGCVGAPELRRDELLPIGGSRGGGSSRDNDWDYIQKLGLMPFGLQGR
jgi:hypothetical protein